MWTVLRPLVPNLSRHNNRQKRTVKDKNGRIRSRFSRQSRVQEIRDTWTILLGPVGPKNENQIRSRRQWRLQAFVLGGALAMRRQLYPRFSPKGVSAMHHICDLFEKPKPSSGLADADPAWAGLGELCRNRSSCGRPFLVVFRTGRTWAVDYLYMEL